MANKNLEKEIPLRQLVKELLDAVNALTMRVVQLEIHEQRNRAAIQSLKGVNTLS